MKTLFIDLDETLIHQTKDFTGMQEKLDIENSEVIPPE